MATLRDIYILENSTIGGGVGDMLQDVYDPDKDGIVDLATEINGSTTANQYYGSNASNQKGFYNLPTGNVGDMLKDVYDTNNDGKVNSAETADTADTATNAVNISGSTTANQYYGSNGSNQKGFYDLPTTDTLPVTVSTNYTLLTTDNKKWIKASGDITITMLLSPPNYFEAIIQNVGTGTITISGVTNAVGDKITEQWRACHVYYDGTSWTAVGALEL